jgi:hypothetical protein
MPLCHRHQLQYLSAHVVGGSPKCRGSTRDRTSDDLLYQPCGGSSLTVDRSFYRKEVKRMPTVGHGKRWSQSVDCRQTED